MEQLNLVSSSINVNSIKNIKREKRDCLLRIGSGCVSIGLVILVLPIPLVLAISALSDTFGPDLKDYCKKENLVQIYDQGLLEKRRRETENRNAVVSDGWKTVVTEEDISKFMFNSVRMRAVTLFFDNRKVAQTRQYALLRENEASLIGIAPVSGKPCRVSTDYRLGYSAIIEPFNDPRFDPPEFK